MTRAAEKSRIAETLDGPPTATLPRLIGVIHLPPLPGSPRWDGNWDGLIARVEGEARLLQMSKYDLAMVENFGDTPFFSTDVPAVTVSAMTACAIAVKRAAPSLPIGVNVLRNDASAALSIATVVGAACVRINVHVGARVTDQGVVEGRAAQSLRLRRALGANVQIWADVDVKHSSPLGGGVGSALREGGAAGATSDRLEQEVKDAVTRGMADAILVTGEGTGAAAPDEKLARVSQALRTACRVPLYVASGATPESLEALGRWVDGVIVGSALRDGGVAGAPLDPARVQRFADAFRGTEAFKDRRTA